MPDKNEHETLDDISNQMQRAITINRERKAYNPKQSAKHLVKQAKWKRQLRALRQHKDKR